MIGGVNVSLRALILGSTNRYENIKIRCTISKIKKKKKKYAHNCYYIILKR